MKYMVLSAIVVTLITSEVYLSKRGGLTPPFLCSIIPESLFNTMIARKTNTPQTLPQYIKWLKRAESKPSLYDNDEYVKIKKELYQAKKLKKLLDNEEKSFRGFGYQRNPMPKVDIQDYQEEKITIEDVVDYTPNEVVESVDVEVVEDIVNE